MDFASFFHSLAFWPSDQELRPTDLFLNFDRLEDVEGDQGEGAQPAGGLPAPPEGR